MYGHFCQNRRKKNIIFQDRRKTMLFKYLSRDGTVIYPPKDSKLGQ